MDPEWRSKWFPNCKNGDIRSVLGVAPIPVSVTSEGLGGIPY